MLRFSTKILILLALLSAAILSKAQVVANFTLSDTAGCAPMVIHFTNTSTGATSYNWDLGNGTTPTLTDVSGSYLTAGVYTITLVAHNGSASSTKTATIHVYAQPTIGFTGSVTNVCPGNPVTFSSAITPGSWGALTYDWNFGDGLTSTATSPSHSYGIPGDYNVTLFAKNGKGCINSLSRPGYIHVYTPASSGFSSASVYLCNPPAPASFTNTTIGVGPFAYLWRFGDGGTSSLVNPTHNYTSSGSFDVTLRVTDGHGCMDSMQLPGYMTIGNLNAAFTPLSTICLNIPGTFFNTSTTHVSSAWDFGDGSTSTDEDGTHAYSATGVYNVRLVVYDGTCYDTVTHAVTVSHPTGSFTITPAQPCPPPRLRTYTATTPPGCTVAWSSLIYGTLGSGSVTSHTVPMRTTIGLVPDTLGEIDSITMVITNSFGCRDTVGRRDTTCTFSLLMNGDKSGCAPLTVHLTPSSYSQVYTPFAGSPWWQFGYPNAFSMGIINYPYAVTSYTWNWGDGSPTSSGPAPAHTYTFVGGVYAVSCLATTANGCHQVKIDTVKVGAPPPMPTFTVSPTRACAGVGIHFNGTPLGTYDEVKWDFGEPNASDAPSAVHIYTVPGHYTPQFWTYYHGCPSNIAMKDDTVDAPGAVLTYSFACSPRNKIYFGDSSIGADTHTWTFGDGSTSTLANPVHTFPDDTSYYVLLTTWNAASGCRDTAHLQLDMTPLHTLLAVSSPGVCRDKIDTVSIAVFERERVDFSWATKYRWYFDGVLTDSLIMTYGYDTLYRAFRPTGNHTAMVLITDNQKCIDTVIQNILVAKPIDSFSLTPVSGCAPLAVTFTDHSTPTPGTTISSIYWSFGDAFSATTGPPSVSHAYSVAGTYSVKTIVTDNLGCKDTIISHTRPVVLRPTAAFSAAITTVCARRSVHFINGSTAIVGQLWFFGDGDTSSAVSPTHFYNTPGNYTVKLVVYSAAGCTDTLVKTNYVTVKPLPTPSFTMTDSFAVCAPFSVSFTNTSSGAATSFWTFGDGTSSTVANPTHVYITPGYYTVKLMALTSFPCADTTVRHVNLFGYSGAFTYAPVSGCSPLPVNFHGSFSSVATVIWDFSDGVTSAPTTLDTISHTYLSSGRFIPKLILTDSFGCTAYSLGADTIRVGNIAAGFTSTPNPVCQGNPIAFHDTTSTSVAPIVSWLWTFGSGYTSTLSAPTFTYTAAGTYTVTLTVTNSLGCSGTASRSILVNSLPPAISGSPVVCLGGSTPFTNTMSGGLWSSSNPSIASVGSLSGMVSGVTLGAATITYSLGSGCTVVKTVTVTGGPAAITGASGVCVGSSATLANATPLGTWSSAFTGILSIGSASGIVTGSSPGTDTIYYTVGGCTAKKLFTVNPLPGSITGNLHVCVGTTSTLSCSPVGGTWTSSSTSIASVGSLTGIVLGNSGGLANITYTTAAGCKSVATVTINSAPGPIAGTSFVCVGGSSTFSNSVPGGTWTSDNTSVAVVGSASGTVTGMGIGTANISYNAGGCTVVKLVSVNALPPAITGPGQVCMGSTATLSDPATGGTWTSSNTLVAVIGSASGIVTAYTPGNTTITYSLGGGCVISTVLTVNPVPSPIAGPTTVCLGSSVTLTDVTTGGTWSSSDPSTVTVSPGGVATGMAGGSVLVSYTLGTGCASTLSLTVLAVPPITGLSGACAWIDTITIHDADTSGSYSSTLVAVANLGHGTGRLTTFAPGVATIIYTVPSGCTAVALLTVNPLPGPISGPTHLCLGATGTLTDTSAGGHWSSSNSTIASVGSSSGIVNGLAAGTVRITYTVATGCRTDTAVTIHTFPDADTITGPSQVCTGQTITLVDTMSGGSWTSGSTSTATVAGGVVTGVSSGTVMISYAISNVCGSDVATHMVTVYTFPATGNISGPDSVCAGSTITLSDTAAGGAWSASNAVATVSGTGVVSGVSPGVDTIIYIKANPACSSRSTHAVTVKPLPDAGTINGPGTLCVWDSLTLTDAATGGTWSQSPGGAALVPVSGGIKVLPVSTGTDTIFYSVTNSCGTAVASHVVVIETIPSVGTIGGPSEVCVGQTITLTDPFAGGLWSSANTGIATVGSVSGIVTGVTTGLDTIVYTLTNACGTASGSKAIAVKPLPYAGVIAGPSAVCVGDSAAFTDPIPGGTWSLENDNATLRGSVVVKGVTAGADVLSYTVSNSCGADVATKALTIEPVPAGIVITRNGHVLSVPSGYAGYQWTLNGSPIAGATSNTYTYSGIGSFGVIITNSFGCSFTCPAIDITDCTPDDILVFPNPSASIVYLQWCDDITVRLSAADGKLIRVYERVTEIDLAYLPNAVYTFTLFDSNGKKLLTKRVTKLTQ